MPVFRYIFLIMVVTLFVAIFTLSCRGFVDTYDMDSLVEARMPGTDAAVQMGTDPYVLPVYFSDIQEHLRTAGQEFYASMKHAKYRTSVFDCEDMTFYYISLFKKSVSKDKGLIQKTDAGECTLPVMGMRFVKLKADGSYVQHMVVLVLTQDRILIIDPVKSSLRYIPWREFRNQVHLSSTLHLYIF